MRRTVPEILSPEHSKAETGFELALTERPRRLRRNERLRGLIRETSLQARQLILPVFMQEREGREAIPSLPGVTRQGPQALLATAREALGLGLAGLALFPVLPEGQKDPEGLAGLDPEGLLPQSVRALKRTFPELLVITDIALDPYSSTGHDGLVGPGGEVLNDASVARLAEMAVMHARAGADVVAPSDMMDGRVGAIRAALDQSGYQEVAILSYSTKYASSYYGPFRSALDSAPRHGDKASYQMDPAGGYREAIRESRLDSEQGADFLMVKPALAYLDVLRILRERFELPILAYNVSGEYAMVKAAAERGMLDERAVVLENLLSIRRAGADAILSYHALDAARWLQQV
jgi:porphobilinogen synthase